MKKARLFLSNILVYGIGGVMNKMVPLFMVPIVTRLMPNTEYYGMSDTLNVITSFCSALAVLGMYDAMFRMFFEKDTMEYKKQVCSTSFYFTLFTSTVVAVIVFVFRNYLAKWFLKDEQYAYLIVIIAFTIFVSSTNNIISAPTRMENKRNIYIFGNVLAPILSYSIAIPLLLKGEYVIALPLSALLSGITLELLYYIINGKWFSFKLFDINLLKSILYIALPIAPNILIYWVYNSCDRFMITYYLGIGQEGVYSIGAKLGQVSQLFYLAFAGGWQYFAFSTMKEADHVETNSRIFEYLAVISFVLSLLLSAFSSTLFKILFDDRYQDGYIVAPYLFLAPLIQMLFQTVATQFTIIKRTYLNTVCLASGAIINVLLNMGLIRICGIEGASIATVMGYVVATLLCVILLIRFKLFVVKRRLLISTIVFMGLFTVWRLSNSDNLFVGILIFIIACIFYLALYSKDFSDLIKTMQKDQGGK